MSLTDKIIEELRDDTYAGGLLDKDEVEEYTDKFTRLTASADQPFGHRGCSRSLSWLKFWLSRL